MTDLNLNLFDFNSVERPISRIEISLKQRNGKKSLTYISGLADDLDLKKIAKVLRKTFKTSGSVVKTKDNDGSAIQLAGDKRDEVKEFLVKYKIWEEPDYPIRMRGY